MQLRDVTTHLEFFQQYRVYPPRQQTAVGAVSMVLVEKLIFLSLVTAMHGGHPQTTSQIYPDIVFIPPSPCHPLFKIPIPTSGNPYIQSDLLQSQQEKLTTTQTLVCLYFWDNFAMIIFWGWFLTIFWAISRAFFVAIFGHFSKLF